MAVKKDNASFISDCMVKHGDRFDYSRVDYAGSKKHVHIRCRRHDEWFTATPNQHLSKNKSCKSCEFERRSNARKSSTSEFVEKAMAVHGIAYGYGRVQYKGNKETVSIWCNKCSSYFSQRPNSHLNGSGCNSCGQKISVRKRTKGRQIWMEKCRRVHGDKYNYSLVPEGMKLQDKVTIICPVKGHAPFSQNAQNHSLGHGCPECAGNRAYTTSSFIRAAKERHNGKYDYSKTEYLGCTKPIIVICPIHNHQFTLVAYSHLFGTGCRLCGGNQPHTTESFIDKASLVHDFAYDYSATVYGRNNKDRVRITCPKHPYRSFEPKAIDHLNGSGCPLCYNKTEAKVAKLLESLEIPFTTQHRISFGDSVRIYDFYLPSKQLLIERDGEQHYPLAWSRTKKPWNTTSSFQQMQRNDELKAELAAQQGLTLIRIPYWVEEILLLRELKNAIQGRPSYPSVPDPSQERAKSQPN